MIAEDLTVKLLKTIEPAEKIFSQNDRVSELKNLQLLKNGVQKKEILLLICGEFKNGKSSLINSIIEQSICPVDIDITTAVVSIIRYGEKNKVIRYFGTVENIQEEIIDFEDIDKYSKASSIDSDDTIFLEIELPAEKLKEGLVLIDTPGVGGLDARHGFLTSYFLSKSDLALFVTSAQDPFSSAELEFYREKVLPVCDSPAIVVNKIDLATNSAEILYDVKNKVGQFCEIESDNIKVLVYSSLLKLEFQRTNKKEDLDESNYIQLEQLINCKIDDYKINKYINVCDYTIEILDDIKSPLIVQLEQLQSNKPIDIETLNDAYKERSDRINELKDPTSAFRRKISRQIQEARSGAMATLQEQFVILSSDKLKKYISEPKANAETVKAKVDNDISTLASKIDGIILSKFDELSCLFESQFNEQMSLGYKVPSSYFEREIKKPLGQKSFDFIRQNYSNVIVAGVITSVLAPISLVVAVGAGAFMIWQGVKSFLTGRAHEREIAIQNVINPQIRLATDNLNKYVNDKFNAFQYAIEDMISTEAKNATFRAKEIVESIQKIEKKNKEQKIEMQQLVEHKIKPIEQLQGYIQRLKEQVK
jgi:ribosome biogenesis GTPase A